MDLTLFASSPIVLAVRQESSSASKTYFRSPPLPCTSQTGFCEVVSQNNFPRRANHPRLLPLPPYAIANETDSDEEWHRKRREESKELARLRKLEEEEEAAKTENYRKMSKRLASFAEEDIRKAKALVANFIKSGEEVEERIVEAGKNGELTALVLLVIQNRLELARHDDERHVIQALDLLYRRIEAEMLRRTASPALQFLDGLLRLHDGYSHDEWIQQCRHLMLTTFPPEDAMTIFGPPGFDLSSKTGPIDMPEDEDVLLRVDFIREVDSLLAEIKAQPKTEPVEGLDPQSVAIRLSQQQKEQAIQQVKELQKLAINLKW